MRGDTREAKCIVCGKVFLTMSFNAVLCSDECRKIQNVENNRKRRERERAEKTKGPRYDGREKQITKHKSTMDDLTRDAIEANKKGMTYGKYMAWRNAQ